MNNYFFVEIHCQNLSTKKISLKYLFGRNAVSFGCCCQLRDPFGIYYYQISE